MKRVGICFVFVLLSFVSSFVSQSSRAGSAASFTINAVSSQGSPETDDLGQPGAKTVLHVNKKPLLSQGDFTRAVVSKQGKRVVVTLTLREEGASRLRDYTRENVGARLAVVVGRNLWGAPVIRAPIQGKEFQVDAFDEARADELVKIVSASSSD